MFASHGSAAPKWYEPPVAMTMRVYDSPPEPSTERQDLRVTPSMKADLEALARLWRIFARANGKPESEINSTYVAKRVIAVGIDLAFVEMGLKNGRPRDEEAWAEVEKSVEKLAKVLGEEAQQEIADFVEQNALIIAAAQSKKK